MTVAGGICLFLSLAYLIWRTTTTNPRVERIPLVLDFAAAVGVAAFGVGLTRSNHVLLSLGIGVGVGGGTAALTAGAYGLAMLIGHLPGYDGVQARVGVPAEDPDEALRWLRARCARSGFVVEEPGPGVDLQAYQGGNKNHYNPRSRPKRLEARLDGQPRGSVAVLELRYVPPATGTNRVLQPFLEEIVSDRPPPEWEPRRPGTRLLQAIEFFIVVGFIFFFGFVVMSNYY